MRGNKKSNSIQRPAEWPTSPQPVTLCLSTMSFAQTSLRNVEGKPPFLRCLLNVDIMAINGIHTDLPLRIENAGKAIVVHAWPSPKFPATDFAIDDAVIKYLQIPRGKKVMMLLSPVDQFIDGERIKLMNCPPSICRALPSIYSNLIVMSGSAVFYGLHSYQIAPSDEPAYFRIKDRTTFESGTLDNTKIPISLETHFQKINELLQKHVSLILTGPSGCGKTSLLKALMNTNPSLSFVNHSLPSLLSGAFGVAERTLRASYTRDVVILENAEILGSDEISRRLISAISDVCEHSTTIVTTIDIDSFPKVLRQSNRFSQVVEIQPPSPEERYSILKSLCGDDITEADVHEAAYSATGFVGGDLQRLLSESIVEGISLSKCLSRVKPASLRHITLEVPEVHWDDIGGYESVKEKLKESVTLPLEKPECFTRLGIRPPRGVLLFGPPGCSKTLMAKAVATESKMNFIAVKGPELFSKFVGESEKAVASVFRKARNASPSIIFFDEIDAMATKRGASGDSGSNVTDRVLTQLLTEMDGVSTRFDQSVIVIAATNRPDLLDPALLRPGRFDRLIYVSLPNEEAREKIFNVHIKRMKFEQAIDVAQLAKQTEGYSGAEIAAICREAAMNVLREENQAEEVSLSHVQSALQIVKPRTPQQLLQWYESFEEQRKY